MASVRFAGPRSKCTATALDEPRVIVKVSQLKGAVVPVDPLLVSRATNRAEGDRTDGLLGQLTSNFRLNFGDFRIEAHPRAASRARVRNRG